MKKEITDLLDENLMVVTGIGSGENKGIDAVHNAFKDYKKKDILKKSYKSCIVVIEGGNDLVLYHVGKVLWGVVEYLSKDNKTIWSQYNKENIGDSVSITAIMTRGKLKKESKEVIVSYFNMKKVSMPLPATEEDIEALCNNTLWKKIKTIKLENPKSRKIYYDNSRAMNYNIAIRELNKLLKSGQEKSYSWYYKALCYEHLNRYEDVIKSFDRAIAIDPKKLTFWSSKLDFLDRLRRYNDIIQCCDDAIPHCPANYVYLMLLKGSAFIKINNFSEAILCYDKVLNLYPKDDRILYHKGMALAGLKSSQHKKAIEYFDEAIHVNPKGAWYYVAKGQSLEAMNKYKKAIESYNKAISIKPEDFSFWERKAMVYIKQKRYSDVIECYMGAVKASNYNKKTTFTNLCNNLIKNKLFKFAIMFCDKMISMIPLGSSVWDQKGDAFYEWGKYKEAINCYDKAMELSKDKESVLFILANKGNALFKMKEFKEALKCYDEALAGDSEDNTYLWMQKIRALAELGKNREMSACINKGLQDSPKDDYRCIEFAELLFDLGLSEKAHKCYDMAIKIRPCQQHWEMKGNVYAIDKRYIKASRCYDEAIKHYPKSDTAWFNQSVVRAKLKHNAKSSYCHGKAIEINPTLAHIAEYSPPRFLLVSTDMPGLAYSTLERIYL